MSGAGPDAAEPARRPEGGGPLLAPVGWLWDGVARLRAVAYERGWRARFRPPVPTLSIGNLAAGGTGKTPLLMASLAWLERHGAQVGVLSRGYGGDEGRILRERHPEAALVEDPDRVRGLARLLEEAAPELILLDDAFQHHRLERDADAVLIDATRPFGRCLPAGLFREGPGALRRATHVVLSRAELVEAGDRERAWRAVEEARAGLPPLPRIEGGVRVRELRELATGETRPASALRGMRARLAAGIGNPASFAALCRAAGVEIDAVQWMPDHHPWRAGDLAGWDRGPAVLVTEKDAVKLRGLVGPGVWEVRVDWEFGAGGEHWESLLTELHLPARAARIEPLWQAHDPRGGGARR